jgi:hypothetical protein
METKMVSESNQPYTATATAKRFSSTSDYAGQHITKKKFTKRLYRRCSVKRPSTSITNETELANCSAHQHTGG